MCANIATAFFKWLSISIALNKCNILAAVCEKKQALLFGGGAARIMHNLF